MMFGRIKRSDLGLAGFVIAVCSAVLYESTKLPPGLLEKVGVIETRDNYFEYAAPAAVR